MNDDPAGCCRSRRAILAGTGAAGVTALLSGCQTYGEPAARPAAPAAAGPGDSATPTDDTQTPALTTVADIPVGGGRIFAGAAVVVTQPVAGTIRAFSARCTHQGCTVTSVTDGSIVCACHNSVFDIADGSVKSGPAASPLPVAAVDVEGDAIRLA
ncbi:Ferredoxin subunit of nitrite reductase or a ring-hydroxylating dioxygenase [Micromonospora nigra]|uniref:Cytochrome bc1 complex Rieske iron-sulfur subunit n=1 Tax=Micromonospora nigra TaxID=145857 RepID=A0A1C6R906_9ACTN|nr:Rieske (2Fe-2S) protein [Micromonospora nigra]SCL13574.1 Ferredoxin subunit of nitrite reductase or a ring-hydroxylating dioxygenase [Micromonospora nigra]